MSIMDRGKGDGGRILKENSSLGKLFSFPQLFLTASWHDDGWGCLNSLSTSLHSCGHPAQLIFHRKKLRPGVAK